MNPHTVTPTICPKPSCGYSNGGIFTSCPVCKTPVVPGRDPHQLSHPPKVAA